MPIRTLVAASTVALLASAGASLAQETVRDGLVAVDVAGTIVEVPVALAAQACGIDAAEIIAAADMANTDAKGADMVAPEPNTAAADVAAATGTDPVAATGAADPAATTEAAVGADAGSTETADGTFVEGTSETPDPGLTAETATGEASTGMDQMADASGTAAADGGTETAAAADAGTGATATEAGTETADAGTAAGEDMMADAELTASGAAGAAAPTVVCQIDQATADQNGITATAN